MIECSLILRFTTVAVVAAFFCVVDLRLQCQI